MALKPRDSKSTKKLTSPLDELLNEYKDNKEALEVINEKQRNMVKKDYKFWTNKLYLCGTVIPPYNTEESGIDIAHAVLKEHLNIETEGLIARASRTSNTVDGTTIGGQVYSKLFIELNDLKSKRYIVKAAMKIKNKVLFVNEYLPEETNKLFYQLRKIKRETNDIAVLYTKDGVIKAKKTRDGTLYHILTKRDMEVFLGTDAQGTQ